MTRAKTPSKASFDAAKDRVVEWRLPTAYRFYEKARKRKLHALLAAKNAEIA